MNFDIDMRTITEIVVFDTYLGLNDSLNITCLLDFETPEIDIIVRGEGEQTLARAEYSPETN